MNIEEKVKVRPIMIVPCNSKGDCHIGEDGYGNQPEYYRVKDEKALAQLILMGAKPWDRWDVEEGTWDSVEEWLKECGMDPDTRCYKLNMDSLESVLDQDIVKRIL